MARGTALGSCIMPGLEVLTLSCGRHTTMREELIVGRNCKYTDVSIHLDHELNEECSCRLTFITFRTCRRGVPQTFSMTGDDLVSLGGS